MNTDVSAEDMLINQINEFSPDVAIMMLNCTHRDDVNSDVLFLKKLAKTYAEINNMRLPIVVVINKCDEMAPTRFKIPSEYPQNKIVKIQEVVQYYKGIIVKNGLKIDDIIAVSSLIDWQTPDGIEIDVENIDNLPKNDIENLQIAFDGLYIRGCIGNSSFDLLHDLQNSKETGMTLKLYLVYQLWLHLRRFLFLIYMCYS